MTIPAVIANFGGGVNSTAMLIGLVERKVKLAAVLFADTGGEKPSTYEHVDKVDEWLQAKGAPGVTRLVRRSKLHKTLEGECHTNKTLPSLVYGFRSCSAKWKRDPMDYHIRRLPMAKDTWATGLRVHRLLGIDAGEAHRGIIAETSKWTFDRPLLEWGWDRDDCVDVIEAEGLPVPEKSACFFCPASTKREVLALSRDHPCLFDRAVAMEHAASEGNRVVKGLGRRWSWEGLVKADAAQLRLFQDPTETACICYDG